MVQAGEHADLSEILVQIEMPVEAEREISRLFSCAKGEKMGGRGSSFKKSGGVKLELSATGDLQQILRKKLTVLEKKWLRCPDQHPLITVT